MFTDKVAQLGAAAAAAWSSDVAKLANELAWLVRCALANAVVAELPAVAVDDGRDGVPK